MGELCCAVRYENAKLAIVNILLKAETRALLGWIGAENAKENRAAAPTFTFSVVCPILPWCWGQLAVQLGHVLGVQ